jgi:hypothetical protein
MTGISLIAVEAWEPAPRRPLVLHPGDRVTVGDRDTEWTAYLWCTARNGASGWVPQDYILMADDGSATATIEYSTIELPVEIGDIVSGYQSAGNWTWCVDDEGRAGWVPNRALNRVS